MQKIKESDIYEAKSYAEIDIIGCTEEYDKLSIEARLKKRIEKGYDTEFEHSMDERLNPELLLKNWKTIIVAGVSYNHSFKPNRYKYGGKISKSASGEDYHTILKEKLGKLAIKLREKYSFNYYIGVDTTPLVDREIAKSAGIGVFGKNNSIINRDIGSFIFLGYILLDIEVDSLGSKGTEFDTDICKDCRKCLDACPTGAIKEGNIMNARICLSYLTQTKNDIPIYLREKMNSMIYGCDICQDVCPYNLVPRNNKIVDNGVDLEELLFISRKSFEDKYGKSAIAWRGKNVLRRNAIVALSNKKNSEAIRLFNKLLNDSSEMVRDYAKWAISRIK